MTSLSLQIFHWLSQMAEKGKYREALEYAGRFPEAGQKILVQENPMNRIPDSRIIFLHIAMKNLNKHKLAEECYQ